MGEAKRKKAAAAARTWGMGALRVVANEVECFGWIGTRQDAADLRRHYLGTLPVGFPPHAPPIDAHSYAKRAAGYLMVYGMPKVGDADRRPSNHGHRWEQVDIDLYKSAVLWLALRERVRNSLQTLEDVFVGKALLVRFEGDKEQIIADTARELSGEKLRPRDLGPVDDPGDPLPADQFRMMVAVEQHNYPLDPRLAVSMRLDDMLALAGTPARPEDRLDDLVHVPRIPLDATEADAMLRMLTIFTDATAPEAGVRTYAGYTDDELRRGQPAVLVR